MFGKKKKEEQRIYTSSIEVFNSEGRTLFSQENIYISHWSENIYKVYYIKDNVELSKIIHKGENMLIIISKS